MCKNNEVIEIFYIYVIFLASQFKEHVQLKFIQYTGTWIENIGKQEKRKVSFSAWRSKALGRGGRGD